VADLPSVNYGHMSFAILYDDAVAAGLKTCGHIWPRAPTLALRLSDQLLRFHAGICRMSHS